MGLGPGLGLELGNGPGLGLGLGPWLGLGLEPKKLGFPRRAMRGYTSACGRRLAQANQRM